MKKKVMVAIDDSECSHYALLWALENLGDTISASQLLIFNAQPFANFAYLSASTYGAARMFFFSFLVLSFLLCSIQKSNSQLHIDLSLVHKINL